MKLKFWGVRGSIPTPGPETSKYGGNTTCLQVTTDNGDLIILDAGTGIRVLATHLPTQLPGPAHILISHTHWDHIHGLPFFSPLFVPGNQIKIYGGRDTNTGEGIERALNVQLQYCYFPIIESELKAEVEYVTVQARQAFKVGSATITPYLMHHPVINFGYRIDCDGKSLFFTGDYEPLLNNFVPESIEFANHQQMIERTREELIQAISHVDALVIDSSYTQEEYASRQGWGHGTHQSSMELAQKARVKKLYFTHHEPTRSDVELEVIAKSLKKDNDFEQFLAYEGLEIQL
jgi:phosphoribosyl 1,2-cyclic phosphodiesterase